MKRKEKPIEHNLLMKNIHRLGDKKIVLKISVVFAIVFFLICNYVITVPSICHTFSDLAQDWIDSKTTKLDIYFSSRPDTDRAS